MKRKSMARAFVLTILLAGFLPQAVRAQLPVKDDFNGGSSLEWQSAGGSWEFTDDQLCAPNFDGGGIFFLPDVGTDLILSVDLKLTRIQPTGALRVGLVAHTNGGQGEDRAWRFIWANKAEQPPPVLVFLEEIVAWRRSNPNVKIDLEKTYTFKMEVRGTAARGKAWEKGTPEPDWQLIDNSFTDAQVNEPNVGLVAVGADVCFDNFSAEALPAVAKGTLAGKLTNTKDNTPLVGAVVEIVGTEMKTVTTVENGTYTVDLEAGAYNVTAFSFGFPAVTRTIEVKGNETTTADFQLSPTSRVAVVLTAKDGKPVDNGLKVVFNAPDTDGFVSFSTKGGREIFRTGPDQEPHGDALLYGDVDDSFLFGGLSKGRAFITIEYFDEGTAPFALHYDAGPAFPEEQFKGAPGGERTDSGEFKTFTWELEDASFSNREQNVADFRIFDGGGGDENDLYISRVIVSTVPLDQIPPDQLQPGDSSCRAGDVTGTDSAVNIEDAVKVLRHIVTLELLPAEKTKAADANKSGTVDISDAVEILQITVGIKPQPGPGSCMP